MNKKKRNVKTIGIIIAGILIFAIAVLAIVNHFYPLTASPNYAPGSGQSSAVINDFSTTDLNGNEITNTIFSDQTLTMVNVWSTFCSPCLKEMPDLNELNEELNEKGFQVIGIVHDVIDSDTLEVDQPSVELAKRICEQTGAEYPVLIPDESLANGLLNGLSGYPTTFFVDSNGSIVGEKVFGTRTKEEWADTIDNLLKDLEASPQ